jgi:hypothetical protein
MSAPACLKALAALDAQLALETAAGPAAGRTAVPGALSSKAVQVLQAAAATACLGARPDLMGAPPRAAQPAPAATPGARPNAAPPTARPVQSTAPAPTAAPLRSVTSCDALGCWSSDGTRLQRVGPNLLGPRGFCSVQGAVLNCP